MKEAEGRLTNLELVNTNRAIAEKEDRQRKDTKMNLLLGAALATVTGLIILIAQVATHLK